MPKYLLTAIISSLLLTIVVFPSFFMAVFRTSSFALGVFIVSALLVFFLMVSNPRNLKKSVVPVTIILILILVHYSVSILINGPLYFERAWLSYLLLIILLLGTFSFSELAYKLSILQSDRVIKSNFYLLSLVGLAGSMHYSPFFKTAAGKAVFFYEEPSFYALSFLPFLLYEIIRSKIRIKVILILIGLLLGMYLESLTLLVGVTLIFMIAFSPKLTLPVLFIALLLLIISGDNYYSNRLDISVENKNLSVMVLIQGWERAYLNLIETHGFGVGFQQFGLIGSVGSVSREIEESYGGNANLFDGGSVAPKFIGEFGGGALIILFIYIIAVVNSVRKLNKFSTAKLQVVDYRQLFFLCCFVMYVMDLFVRGAGYFTPSGFLFMSSLWSSLLNSKVFCVTCRSLLFGESYESPSKKYNKGR